MDAPLGWPNGLTKALAGHVAGRPIGRDANLLFNRETDLEIRSRLGLKPLEVGADRIARVARTALELLEHLGSASGYEVPLLWDPAAASRIGAIEVYPKATLGVHGLPYTGYKGSKPEHRAVRRDMVQRLGNLLSPCIDREELIADDDLLDAAICAFAGHDFLTGNARAPKALTHCRTESWIWVRDTGWGDSSDGQEGVTAKIRAFRASNGWSKTPEVGMCGYIHACLSIERFGYKMERTRFLLGNFT